MASHGAMKEQAASVAATPKKSPQFLRHMRLEPAQNGGVVVHHEMNNWDEKKQLPHTFSSEDGHKLAAHIEKHLGIKMPGKAEGREGEPDDEENAGKD